jgi:hypothetical protein
VKRVEAKILQVSSIQAILTKFASQVAPEMSQTLSEIQADASDLSDLELRKRIKEVSGDLSANLKTYFEKFAGFSARKTTSREKKPKQTERIEWDEVLIFFFSPPSLGGRGGRTLLVPLVLIVCDRRPRLTLRLLPCAALPPSSPPPPRLAFFLSSPCPPLPFPLTLIQVPYHPAILLQLQTFFASKGYDSDLETYLEIRSFKSRSFLSRNHRSRTAFKIMKKILEEVFQANGKRLKCCPASVLRQAQGVVRSGGDLVYVVEGRGKNFRKRREEGMKGRGNKGRRRGGGEEGSRRRREGRRGGGKKGED